MFKLSAERAAADSYVDDALDTTRSATVTSVHRRSSRCFNRQYVLHFRFSTTQWRYHHPELTFAELFHGKDDRSLTFSISTHCQKNRHNGLLYTVRLLDNSGQQTTLSVVDPTGNLSTPRQPSLSPAVGSCSTSSCYITAAYVQLTCQPVNTQSCQQSGDAAVEQQDCSVLNSHDGTSIDCVSVADCSSNSTSLLSPISIMSLVSEPTSLDSRHTDPNGWWYPKMLSLICLFH